MKRHLVCFSEVRLFILSTEKLDHVLTLIKLTES